jgi:FkbM family methyltransferase
MMQIGEALSLTEGQSPRHMSWRNTARSILNVVSTIWMENTGIDRCVFLLHGFIWQLRKRLGHSLVTTLANGAKLKVYPNTAFSAAFYTRWLERKDLLFIRAHADLAPTFVDVGANIGLFSALLFDKFSYFILIEPVGACMTALRETCALNPSIRCEIINVAVSNRPGVASFLDEGDFSTTSRIVDKSKVDSPEVIPVVAETLDRILLERQEDFIVKVDVEGHERQVFDGALQLLGAERIKLLMFERLGRTNLDDILTFFETVNYVVFYILEDGSVTLDAKALRTPLINLFACPRSVLPRLAKRAKAAQPSS